MFHQGRYWHALDDGRIQCDLCPRFCKMNVGQRGLCSVRGNDGQGIALLSYGQASGFCIDPIEKKPLNHFYPGTPVLSFGQTGCNLTCSFCQNWNISKHKETALQETLNEACQSHQVFTGSKERAFDKLQAEVSPQAIVEACQKTGCKSVAFTYNDPVIFLEYAVDVARACRKAGIKTVAVTAGYIASEARKEFFSYMDAANIDLKAFTEDFYHRLCSAHLDDVLETLIYLKHETNVWFELTDLIIPGENDSEDEIDQMTKWVVKELGCDVPMHFSAFHPDWKMMDKPRTPPHTLIRAREIAIKNGVRYAYTGNVHHEAGDRTSCFSCGETLIQRDWYELSVWNLTDEGRCKKCGTICAGHFDGPAGNWGRKRVPLQILSSTKDKK
jgi:pyruvate formate lyase activating enzyme